MEVSVLKTIKRIRKEAPRRFTELRDQCDELIEHGYLRGKRKLLSPVTSAGNEDSEDKFSNRRTLMDLVIETINKCSEDFDEGVQVQVIKALLIAVTSSHCEVHEASLLLAVRACFHIHLISKNQVNKTTAKAALTQMLSVVNQRMENFDARAKAETEAALSMMAVAMSNNCFPPESSTTQAISAAAEDISIVKHISEDAEVEEKVIIIDDLGEIEKKIDVSHADNESADDADTVHTNEALDIEVKADTTVEVELEIAPVVTQDVTIVVTNISSTGDEQRILIKEPTRVAEPPVGVSTSMAFPSIMHKDAFLIFRALCKLSMKGLHESDESGSLSDPIALQNKVLSLELILHILQSSGPAFRTGEKFIYAVRNYLCVSLLGNCTSQVTQVVGLSLQIFLALMDDFKDHLKSELEVFITTIFLRILESENSTYDHKLRVLEVFHRICKDSGALVEIFINYDCEMEAIDLFRRIVDGFAKIAKNPTLTVNRSGDFLSSAGGKRAAIEEKENIRGMGLKGLVIVLQSLLRYGGLWQGVSPDIVDSGDVLPPGELPSMATARTIEQLTLKNTNSNFYSNGSINNGNSNGNSNMNNNNNNNNNTTNNNNSSNNGGNIGNGSGNDLKCDNDDEQNTKFDSDQGSSGTIEIGKGSIVDNFDRKQKAQEEIENGILKFNQSSKKGIAFLVDRGHVEMTPKGVALFLRQHSEKLDKTAVGEYLGREREYEGGFCLKVLHEFVDSMDFSNMAFDLAIRYFLAGFRLPGEAQKIDRLMEKFAERYYLQNKDTFASADMAFILAFSTIMLQTNLHNPAIKDDKRMTKEQFVKQNKGISADGELPEEMLLEIYERIAAAPISMTQDVGRRNKKEDVVQFNVFQTSTDKRRKDAFNDERKEMVRNGEAMFKQASKKTSVFVRSVSRSSGEAYVRPMFEVVWAPIIGVLSEILETCDDAVTVNSSLAGLYYAIRLACRLDFPIARHTFLNALSKFTTLETVREMHMKEVSCIKLLLNIALSEGSFLDESWSKVLQVVSQLARLQLFANRSHTDDMFFGDVSSHTADGSSATASKGGRRNLSSTLFATNSNITTEPFTFTKMFAGPSRAETARQMEESNASLLMQEINPILLDKIFLGSASLGGESVHHFVRCLCEVSMLEISSSSSLNNLRAKDISSDTANPRVFSLQKLVEVADVNMFSRPRLQWGRIWKLLAEHFTTVGVHENSALAMYAIDSLKQLSIKFLQKEELSNFNFQRVFLKPFEVILARTRTVEIKDLVLRCIDVLVRACATNIRSGWRSIFVTFEVAAAQDSIEIARIALDITERLLTTQFDLLIYDFVELINCLVSFVACIHTSLSLRALNHLYRCAAHLADGTVEPALDVRTPVFLSQPCIVEEKASSQPHTQSGSTGSPSSSSMPNSPRERIDEDASVFRLWWPLLLGLSTRVADPRVQVRERALNTLTNVLRTYGSIFSSQTWVVIFKGVLFPMLDSAKTDSSWIESMCYDVLSVSIEMFCMLHDMNSLSPTLLPDLITIIEGCVCQENEILAKIGMKAWNELISSMKSKMDIGTLDLMCSRILRCSLSNLCTDFGDGCKLSLSPTKSAVQDGPSAWMKEVVAPAHVIKQLITSPCPIVSRGRERERSRSALEELTSIMKNGESTQSTEITPRDDDVAEGAHTIASSGDMETLQDLSDDESSVGSSIGAGDSELSQPISIKSRNEINDLERRVMALKDVDHNFTNTWKQYSTTIRTCSIVSLALCKLTGDLLLSSGEVFQICHLDQLLIALEVQYWHALLLHSNTNILSFLSLKEYSIITPGPYLIEQEVIAARIILRTIIDIYLSSESCQELGTFITPWMSRMGSLVCTRYIQLESEKEIETHRSVMNAKQQQQQLQQLPPHQQQQQQLSLHQRQQKQQQQQQQQQEQPEASFASCAHAAYTPVTLILLKGILDCSTSQFSKNSQWLIPILSKLILCNDPNIRLFVSSIYTKHVNNIVLEAFQL